MKSLKFLLIAAIILAFVPLVFAQVDQDFLILINNERAIQGSQPLNIDSLLTQVAQTHSQDQMSNNYFSHFSQNGDNPGDRLDAAGYFYTTWGENIAWHSGQPNAQQVFDMWYDSPGHYQNMINPDFTEIGLGIAQGAPYQSSPVSSTVYTLLLSNPESSQCSPGENETINCGLTNTGECTLGTQTHTCQSNGQWGSWSQCNAVMPVAEICSDGLDNDCDGNIDESCQSPQCTPNQQETQQCGQTDIGMCEYGTQIRTCNSNSQWSSWGSCQGAINPSSEICDQQDNDCDNQIDENLVCEPLSVVINTPEENSVFFDDTVKINATLNKKSTRLDIYDNEKRIATCFNCASFEKSFSFNSGQHNIIVNATAQNEIAQDLTNFSVIISDLNLVSINPKGSRDIIGKNATFTIKYRSDLPIIAMVHINGESYDNTLEQSCPASSSTQTCIFNLMPPEGLNETAMLRYHIFDETSASEEKNASIFFDTINPQLTITSNTTIGTSSKRIKVTGFLTEKSKVTYFDQSRNRTRNICTRCEKFTRTFTVPINGTLTLPITITDLAENKVEQSFEFS